MDIRKSTSADSGLIRKLHVEAFDVSEREAVAKLALDLIDESESVLSLVAVENDEIIGHVVFSPMKIMPDDNLSAYILAPLAVAPDRQKQGVGSRLIRSGMDALAEMKVDAVFVLGDPDYYGRSGFRAGHGVSAPYPIPYPEAWLIREVTAGALQGVSGTAQCLAVLMDPEHW